MQQLPQNAQRQPRVAQCESDAHRGGSRHRHGISEPVPLPQIVTQSQQDQHNGYGINGVQDGDGNAQDHAQPQIAHEEREKRNDIHPRPIGNFPEKGGKILRNGIDKPNAGGQAGQRKDGRQQHCPGAAKHLIDNNECDITELDKRCGFTSRSVFYDAFGKIMGIPPAHYRKRREKAAETCSGFSGTMENSLGKNEIHQQQVI